MDPSSESFLRACGAAGPLALSVVGPGDDRRRAVLTEQAFVLVGRDPRAGVCLESEQISPRHAYFQLIGGRIYCIDLGSRSGIHQGHVQLLNGWLNPGRFVRMGPYHLACKFLPMPSRSDISLALENPLQDKVANPENAIGLTADILVKNIRQSRWRMNRSLVLVGSSPLSRMRLRDPSVSRFHCSLIATPSGIWVVDLLSRGGICLNETPVSCARIGHEDLLQVGCFDIRFQLLDQPSRQSLVDPMPLKAMTSYEGMGNTSFPLVPARLSPSEESALVPILQQFGMMQQEMMGQFQQSMMMMLQMFTKMHHDQMGVIREELASMQQLTKELLEAKQKLAGSTASPSTPAPAIEPTAQGRSASVPHLESPAIPQAPPTMANPATTSNISDVHGWLSHRIATLEKERLTVWQRILGSFVGR